MQKLGPATDPQGDSKVPFEKAHEYTRLKCSSKWVQDFQAASGDGAMWNSMPFTMFIRLNSWEAHASTWISSTKKLQHPKSCTALPLAKLHHKRNCITSEFVVVYAR